MSSAKTTAVACTLYAGHYHYGVGALANSLYRGGYRGTMYVGYKPPLPPWAIGGRQEGDDTIWQACPDFSLRFVPWTSERNFTNEKAHFLLHALDHVAPRSDAALIFDADIVVKASWAFFENWVRCGVALCLDVAYPVVPAGHPWRQAWRSHLAESGYACRDLDYYVNGGFVGLLRRDCSVLERWAALTDRILQGVDARDVKFGPRESPYQSDQDTLNAALMAGPEPLSIIGQEAMDFVSDGYVMSHAVDAIKPWRRRFIRDALGGHRPSPAEKAYWANVDGPIRMFSEGHVRRARHAIKIASAIGRFYRSS